MLVNINIRLIVLWMRSTKVAKMKSTRYVIKDINTHNYYRESPHKGWYSPDVGSARLYVTESSALRTIEKDDHHVSFPGNRVLEVVPVTIQETRKIQP